MKARVMYDGLYVGGTLHSKGDVVEVTERMMRASPGAFEEVKPKTKEPEPEPEEVKVEKQPEAAEEEKHVPNKPKPSKPKPKAEE